MAPTGDPVIMATPTRLDKFPLWLHPTGQWCKKVKGVFRYFGTDKAKALDEYVRVREDLAGRKPRPKRNNEATVKDAVNTFLAAKRERVDSGELTPGMWGEYFHAAEQVIETFGRTRAVADLRPSDFGELRSAGAKRLGPAALSKFVTMVRTLFGYAYRVELIDVPVRFGDQFDKTPKRLLRLRRAQKAAKLVSAADLWKLIGAADVQLRAMLYLAINCGFGQTDCSDLQRSALELRP